MRIHAVYALLVGWGVLLATAAPGFQIFSSLQQSISLPFSRLQSFMMPAPREFWDQAIQLGDKLKTYTDKELRAAAVVIPLTAKKIDEFKNSMTKIVASTKELRNKIEGAAEKHGLTIENVSDILSEEMEGILQDFKGEFSGSLPDNEGARLQERVRMVTWVLLRSEDAVVKATDRCGIPEAKAREGFQAVAPHVKHIVLVTGNLADRYPKLFETLIFAALGLLVPESWFLRPFLRLFGFGPYGPVKGSTAAWAQRRIFGAAVQEGSWFAVLQSAGMAGVGFWQKALASMGLAAGVVGSLRGCFR